MESSSLRLVIPTPADWSDNIGEGQWISFEGVRIENNSPQGSLCWGARDIALNDGDDWYIAGPDGVLRRKPAEDVFRQLREAMDASPEPTDVQ